MELSVLQRSILLVLMYVQSFLLKLLTVDNLSVIDRKGSRVNVSNSTANNLIQFGVLHKLITCFLRSSRSIYIITKCKSYMKIY